jgi:hypothetical chaperone protein
MRLGVDFGTTNSSIAFYDGQELHTIQADPANDDPTVMPSLLYIDRQQQITVGARAADAFLEYETGRPVRWRLREAGEIEITVASVASAGGDPIEFVQPVSVLVDDAANGRLIQSVKTALFNGRYEGTRIFGKFYRVDDLIAILLGHLRQAAKRQTGAPCTHIVLGRPVQFSPNPLVDSRAEAILLKAAYTAGFTDVILEKEPVGVAYRYHRQQQQRQTVLVFDFGGGTLDMTIGAVGGPTPPAILASGGVTLGGNDLDRRIMTALLPYFGGGDGGILPADMSDKLLAWQTMPELSRPRYLEKIHFLKRRGHRTEMEALESLITHNVGFKLYKEIERVKQQLSQATSAALIFEYDAIHIHETLTRRRFERMIAADLALIRASLNNLMQQAHLNRSQIDVVLRTGGSSLIPAVRDILADLFGTDKVQDIDPLISVTGGFAVAAYDLPQDTPRIPVTAVLAPADPAADRFYHIEVGVRVYPDRDFVVNRIPPALNRLPALQTTHADHTAAEPAFLRFSLRQPARVLIGYDTSAQRLPAWLQGFEPETMRIEIEDAFALIQRTMQLYGRDFPAGPVTLGGNQAPGFSGESVVNYLIILQPHQLVSH